MRAPRRLMGRLEVFARKELTSEARPHTTVRPWLPLVTGAISTLPDSSPTQVCWKGYFETNNALCVSDRKAWGSPHALFIGWAQVATTQRRAR